MLQADKVTVSKHLRILLPPSRQSKSQQETQIVEERGSRDSMAMVEKPRGSSKLDKPPVKLACLSWSVKLRTILELATSATSEKMSAY
jgi:hypothetical protein